MRILPAVPLLAALTLAAGVISAVPAGATTLVEVTEVSGDVVAGEYVVLTRADGGDVAARSGVRPAHEYAAATPGFAATLTDAQLARLRRDRDVLAIEPNQRVHALTTQTPTPNWGLDRIDQVSLPLNNQYTYNATGAGVTAYVIDTGIDPTHPDFGGRAAVAHDALGGNGLDCNNHGTHVAGIVGSATYGVAKNVQLRGVRVLNCAGSGTIAQVIAGLNWVQANSPGPAVAVMAIGGGFSGALNAAVDALWNSGVFLTVAGGSSGGDACNFSPSGAATAFAVAATTSADGYASFNNRGPCIDLCAPGVSIRSTIPGGGSAVFSGTSMATAHAAGVGALFKSAVGDVPSAVVASWLTAVAVPLPQCRLLHTNGI